MTITMFTEDKSDDETKLVEHTISLTNVDWFIAHAVASQLRAVRDWAQFAERQRWAIDSTNHSWKLLSERVDKIREAVESHSHDLDDLNAQFTPPLPPIEEAG